MEKSPNLHKINEENQFFIPMVPPYVRQDILSAVLPHTSWIGMDLFQLKHSGFYQTAVSKGVKDTFGIDDKTRVFLTSIAEDKELTDFYSKPNWFEELRSDINGFDADFVMGPDWFSYRDDSPEQRAKDLQKAHDLNMKFADQENVIPTIRGNYCQEIKRFIKPFKEIGKDWFMFTGREYLVNRGDRKRSEFELLSLTSNIVRDEKIKLIITGCSSPRQQEYLSYVSGFTGQGWLIRAKKRMLLKGKSYKWLFDPAFSCADHDCCGSISKIELAESRNDYVRAIHNLKRIIEGLQTPICIAQPCLEDFCGVVL